MDGSGFGSRFPPRDGAFSTGSDAFDFGLGGSYGSNGGLGAYNSPGWDNHDLCSDAFDSALGAYNSPELRSFLRGVATPSRRNGNGAAFGGTPPPRVDNHNRSSFHSGDALAYNRSSFRSSSSIHREGARGRTPPSSSSSNSNNNNNGSFSHFASTPQVGFHNNNNNNNNNNRYSSLLTVNPYGASAPSFGSAPPSAFASTPEFRSPILASRDRAAAAAASYYERQRPHDDGEGEKDDDDDDKNSINASEQQSRLSNRNESRNCERLDSDGEEEEEEEDGMSSISASEQHSRRTNREESRKRERPDDDGEEEQDDDNVFVTQRPCSKRARGQYQSIVEGVENDPKSCEKADRLVAFVDVLPRAASINRNNITQKVSASAKQRQLVPPILCTNSSRIPTQTSKRNRVLPNAGAGSGNVGGGGSPSPAGGGIAGAGGSEPERAIARTTTSSLSRTHTGSSTAPEPVKKQAAAGTQSENFSTEEAYNKMLSECFNGGRLYDIAKKPNPFDVKGEEYEYYRNDRYFGRRNKTTREETLWVLNRVGDGQWQQCIHKNMANDTALAFLEQVHRDQLDLSPFMHLTTRDPKTNKKGFRMYLNHRYKFQSEKSIARFVDEFWKKDECKTLVEHDKAAKKANEKAASKVKEAPATPQQKTQTQEAPTTPATTTPAPQQQYNFSEGSRPTINHYYGPPTPGP